MTQALAARLRELIDTKGFDAALPTIKANLPSILTALEDMERMKEALEECEAYFDERAEAEYFPDRAAGGVPNEEMRLLVRLRAAVDATKEKK